MDQPGLVEESQAIQKLLGEDADQSCAEATELVLLDKFVQVDAEQLEDEAKMLSVDKGVFQSEKMVIIVFVELRIELFCYIKSAQANNHRMEGEIIPSRAQTPPSYSG